MRFCHACREPAVRSGASGHGAERAILRYYCYVHAREAGLLEGRLASLLSTGAATGYATNAVVFVLEALHQRGCIIARDAERPVWSLALPVKTEDQFGIAIRLWAIERFDFHEHLVLKHWKLIRGQDVGTILLRLAEAGVLARDGKHVAQVLKKLLALRRELLTFPYDEPC